ncbi:DUF47 family protein [Kribbella shirazensis]|uniref:DUF47 family protein n=1 Tax=Kribbella shirazensis TaxID=1105143 RepID=A0A7X6A218_9ACTN|nr:hypothetical protein [Kribbella shirazensis]
MKLRRLFGDLTGRTHHRVVDLLQAQLTAALAGGALAVRMTAGELSTEQARTEMARIEHDGDSQRAALVAELSKALTTPIDREDLYRLSRSVDDVLDNLRDLVRETDLYSVRPDPADVEILTTVAEGLELLRNAVAAVIDRPAEVRRTAVAARKCSGRVRQLYQSALAALFLRELSTDVLKRRELLRRLDIVGLRLGECADALSDAMLKRSH